MKLHERFYNWIIDHSDNTIIVGIITLFFPAIFHKKYYDNNKNSEFSKKCFAGKACLTISFDCDYPHDVEAIPEVLKIFSKYTFKTSFACVGHWIEKFPNEHKMLLDSGHEIMNHTFSHPDNEILNPGRKFKEISRIEKKEEIERCHDICKRILKYAPIGCRIPHFKKLFTPEIYGILKEVGYVYSSSTHTMNTRTFGYPFKTEEGIWEFPLSTCPKHPFTVFDTWHSLNSSRLLYKLIHRTEDEYVGLFKALIEIAIATNSYANIYIDPYDVLKMKKFDYILKFLQERSSDIRIAPYDVLLKEI